ncbi:MAG: aromatic ring-hydroxylating dioxygenase subunit alpha [Pseudomonadota bacterium]
MADHDPRDQFATARYPGRGVKELFEEDTRDVPDMYREDSWRYLGSEPLDADRYTSREFFELEKKRMWPRVWQFAAREEEMPEPGDFVVYENVGKSYLLVRQDDGSIKTFHNVCLHRGRKLRLESGFADEFECPFHGFTWDMKGDLKRVPCRWDFAHLEDKDMSLPEVRTESFQGYIYINEDGKAPPLEEYLAPLPEHFARWRYEECSTALWIGKVIPANWKVVSEAFMEAWHSVVTHPQILPFTGDENTRYSLWGDHVNLALTPSGILSPHVENEMTEADVLNAISGGFRNGEGADKIVIPEGMDARKMLAETNREKLRELGYDADDAADTEMLDNWTYNVFPNHAPWGSFVINIVYRWRPWPDENHTLMEVRLLQRAPKGETLTRAPEMRLLGPDEPWTAVEDWGALGEVFEQDMSNLPYVQDGLHAHPTGKVELGNYQESRIRHFHRTMDKYLAMGNA